MSVGEHFVMSMKTVAQHQTAAGEGRVAVVCGGQPLLRYEECESGRVSVLCSDFIDITVIYWDAYQKYWCVVQM